MIHQIEDNYEPKQSLRALELKSLATTEVIEKIIEKEVIKEVVKTVEVPVEVIKEVVVYRDKAPGDGSS